MALLVLYVVLAITVISGAPMPDANDNDELVAPPNPFLQPVICETEVLLNQTSCHPADSSKVVYCLDGTTSNCECEEGTFCHYVGMLNCVFICLYDRRAGGPEILDQKDFSESSIKGPIVNV